MNNKMPEIRIVLCGIHEQGIDIARFLSDSGLPIAALVTISQDVAEKNHAAGWVSYEEFAAAAGIPLYHAESYSFKSARDQEYFQREKFDVMILGGWQRLVPPSVLQSLKHGGLGQHGSSEFLPKYRGRSPLNWSIILGKKRLIWHLFLMTPGIDDGDIIDHIDFDINEWDDCQTLYYKVAVGVKRMYLRTIPRLIAGTAEHHKQIGEASYYPKRTPEDGMITWTQSVFAVYNLIRGVTRPYPGAFALRSGVRLPIWQAQPWDTRLTYHGVEPGQVVEVFQTGDFAVTCFDGLLLVTDYDGPAPKLGERFD